MNFDNTIVTRSKNKRKILYELNENGELEEVTEGVTLNIKKKSKIIDDDDPDYNPSDDEEFLSQEEEYEDDTEIIPVKQAWKDSLDIIQDDTVLENDNNDTIRLIKDSLRDVVMDRVMRRLQENGKNRDEEEEELNQIMKMILNIIKKMIIIKI